MGRSRETAGTVLETRAPAPACDAFERVRAVMDLLPVGIILVVGDSVASARAGPCNAAYVSIVGVAPAIGSRPSEQPHAYFYSDRTEPLPQPDWPVHRAIASGEPVRGQVLQLRRRDGEWRVVSVTATPLTQEGRVQGAVVVYQDLTAQHDLEKALREGEQRWRQWLEATPCAAWWIDPAGSMECNRYWFDYTGQSPDEIQDGGWARALHPDDRGSVAQALEAANTAGKTYEAEFRVRRASDGTYRRHLARGLPVLDAAGHVLAWVGTTTEVEDSKRAEEALRESEARGRAILSSLAEGVVFHDADGVATTANQAALELLGLSMGELTDRQPVDPGWSIVRPDGSPFPREEWPVTVALRTGQRQRDVEAGVRRPDGTLVWLSVNARPLHHPGGKVVGAVVSFFDVTHRKHAEETLREADRKKDRFLAMLSHELRNPLAPIRAGLAILERAPGDAGLAARARAVIDRQVAQLTRLVEDLLDVSRIARGKVQLRAALVELRELVQRAVEDYRSLFEASRIEVRLELAEGPLWVKADPTRVAQAIGNLLHNAVKFTPAEGCVVVGVGEQPGLLARLYVRDNGIGIEAAMKRRVFEPFAQASGTLRRSKGGLGLGLALVKGLVELHGGAVEVRSEGPGKGSEFAFTLPLEPEPARSPVLTPPERGGAAAGRRVLVIEDNEDGALTLRDLLELSGHEVEIASNGEDGIEAVRRLRPEVVLCDIGLPGMDGYEVARALRASGSGFAGKLVALTGFASPEDEKLALEAGFDRQLAKPPDLDELAAVLRAP